MAEGAREKLRCGSKDRWTHDELIVPEKKF
jgi:hypothetical protein